MKTLFQEGVKKIKTITVLIRKKSHPKYQTENLHPIIIIIVLLVLQEENDGHAPSYSTMQIRTLKLLTNVNTENDDNNKVIVENNVPTNRDNNSWMFDNNSFTILKHESVPSTTLLALHRLHPLLLHHLLLLMTKEVHTYGITI